MGGVWGVGCWVKCWVEEIDECRVGEGTEPREEGERNEPRSDRVSARRDRPADIDHLERIRTLLKDASEERSSYRAPKIKH
jgi:hypothetical protein